MRERRAGAGTSIRSLYAMKLYNAATNYYIILENCECASAFGINDIKFYQINGGNFSASSMELDEKYNAIRRAYSFYVY